MPDLSSVLREIAVIGTATGLSIGALIGCALLFYFVSFARPAAVKLALVVVLVYASSLYCYHLGRSGVRAEWDAANARAAAAAQARDQAIAAELERKYAAQIAQLQQQSDEFQREIADYERQLLAGKITGAGVCLLGADALRLRGQP